MIFMKLLHMILGIAFPLIVSTCTFRYSDNCSPIPSLQAFIHFCSLMMSCGFIHLNKLLTLGRKKTLLSTSYRIVSGIILWSIFSFFLLHVFTHLHSKWTFFLFFTGFSIVVAFGLIFRIKLGFSETLFNLIVVPLVVMLCHLLIMGEFSVEVAV